MKTPVPTISILLGSVFSYKLNFLYKDMGYDIPCFEFKVKQRKFDSNLIERNAL